MEEVPFKDRHVPRVEIDWDRSAWWWYPLTRAIHPAIRMVSLALSLLALMIAGMGVVVGDGLFRPSWQSDAFNAMATFESFEHYRGGFLSSPIVAWIVELPAAFVRFDSLGLAELAFLLFVLFWWFATFALFGGVLARRSAVELGQRTIATWGESIQIVGSRWRSYLWASGMHLVGIVGLLVPALVLGWLSRLGTVGALVAGGLLLLLFPLVFGIGRFALSAVVCFPLSVCAIGVERKADAFEGFSRSNAYFFQRPVVGVVCVVLLMLCGFVGEQIVYWTLTLGWSLMSGAFYASGGDSTNYFRALGDSFTVSLIGAYWFSFFWSASAAVYLILRKSVDNCELDEMEIIESEVELSLPNIPPASIPATDDSAEVPQSPEAVDLGSKSGVQRPLDAADAPPPG